MMLGIGKGNIHGMLHVTIEHTLYKKTQAPACSLFAMKVHINNELLISSYITIVVISMYRQLFITMHLWNADIHTSLAVKFSMYTTM